MIKFTENTIINDDIEFEKGGVVRCEEGDFIVLDIYEDGTQRLVNLEDGYIVVLNFMNRTFNDCIKHGILHREKDFEIKSGYYAPKYVNVEVKLG